MKIKILFFLILIIHNVIAQNSIIPAVLESISGKGYVLISENTSIFFNHKGLAKEAEILQELVLKTYHVTLKTEQRNSKTKNQISLLLLTTSDKESEAYSLKISDKGIEIQGSKTGIFYGIQSLIQLIKPDSKNFLSLPCLEIKDQPEFAWRGMHLDVSRHFFKTDFIKKYIDYLAMYKINVFHWHLTDDQGWRIEIKKYPLLTQIGSIRKGTLIGHASASPEKFDTISHSGFYTQNEIREIVKYAEEKHISIVPEIEMPGHAIAALSAYPEYSCTGAKLEVEKKWGIFNDVFCPKEETFNFLEDILTEVMALFPGKYIHIGGDECPKTRWKTCKNCQALIKKNKLKNEHELQSYFIQRIEKFVNSKGKSIIGWDEILEGGLAPNAAVMSWRGTQGGIDAAKQKHYVVMSPGSHCYFDHYQGTPRNEPLAIGGFTPIEKVYQFNPIPDELSPDEKKYILGAQANVWTEYIVTPEQVEYMVFPRICALAEVLWSSKEKRNYSDFQNRLTSHFNLLDRLKINYAKSYYDLKITTQSADKKGLYIFLSSQQKNMDIFYTTDGTEPTINSAKYFDKIKIDTNVILKAAIFEGKIKKGKTIEQQIIISKASGRQIKLANDPSPNYNNGGSFALVDGIYGMLPWNGKEWLGFNGTNLEAVIDFEDPQEISQININFLKAENSWIYLPKFVGFYISTDGINFTKLTKIQSSDFSFNKTKANYEFPALKCRFVKIIAENFGIIPTGLSGEGNPAWLFCDEIFIK